MCNVANTHRSDGALAYYATWLGPAAPRIAATHAAAPLPVLVDAVLDELTAAGRAFTAYDVTLIVRALCPRRQLPHYDRHGASGVQPEVHRQMAGYLSGGGYTARVVYPNGLDEATLYMPVARPGRGRSLLNLLRGGGSSGGASSLPGGAWVVRR